jgi:3'-phosphoadenosine 5'-phosphosulfate sulfotransferase (PAPS reductase)/FAD synthetase
MQAGMCCKPLHYLDAIEDLKLDAALGGGRRDEEKARAKERFFSHQGRIRPMESQKPKARAMVHYTMARKK